MSKRENRPRELIVETSAGKIKVGRLTFDGYASLKEVATEAMSGSTLEAIAALVGGEKGNVLLEKLQKAQETGWNPSDTLEVMPILLEKLNSELPYLAGTALRRIDSITHEIVNACLKDPIDDIGALDAEDVLNLRAAALEINDFKALFESEKNCFAGIVERLKATVGSTISPLLSPLGESDGSTSLPTATDGPPTKSDE